MNREQELWAIALWIEQNHPGDAAEYIGQQVRRLTTASDQAGIAMWMAVAGRYDALQHQTAHA